MSNVKNNNIPTMDVEGIIEKLSSAYSKIINNNVNIKTFPSVMLWGAPGVGKSQAVRQIAKEIELQTGKKAVVTDVRLLLFNPIDLRGIPTSNADKTLAVWLKPQIFQMDESEKIVNVLFLDEISAAPQSVQAAAYQITLDRIWRRFSSEPISRMTATHTATLPRSIAFMVSKKQAILLLLPR